MVTRGGKKLSRNCLAAQRTDLTLMDFARWDRPESWDVVATGTGIAMLKQLGELPQGVGFFLLRPAIFYSGRCSQESWHVPLRKQCQNCAFFRRFAQIYATSRGTALSASRRNRELRAPATTFIELASISCKTLLRKGFLRFGRARSLWPTHRPRYPSGFPALTA